MSESSQPVHPVDKPGRLAELEKVIARQTYKQRGSAPSCNAGELVEIGGQS
jgi:hypothetical protein